MTESVPTQGIESNRLEAFSDAVIAVIITIMVLEIHAPDGGGFSSLKDIMPTLYAYVLSFTFIGIYWNNHHHLLRATKRISAPVMWANLHLLFWLSLIPFVTAWVGEHPGVGEHPISHAPAASYGVVGVMSAVAYTLLVSFIKKANTDTGISEALANSYKGTLSLIFYICAVPLAFVNPIISYALYVAVSVMWFVPDRRLAEVLE